MEAAANDDENTAAAPGNNIFDAVYGDRISAVTEAVMNNRPDLLENLIKEGKPIDMCDNRGWFTLHHAAFLGYTECVNLLLRDDSCEINCQSYDNSTPLMLACTNLPFARDVVHLLCKKNADVNAKNDQGYCPLHAATCADEVDVKVIKWLVRAGGKVKAVSGHGTTPLHTLYERSRGPIALGAHTVPRLARLPDNEERMDTAKYLIKHGASQLECEEDEPRPFQQALISGCFRSAKILLEHIDKSERKEFLSYAPRHFNSFYVSVANRWIDPEFVNFLLESGADPNAFCGEDQDTLPLLGLLGGAGRETDEHLKVLERLLEVTTVYGPKYLPRKHPWIPKTAIELCISKNWIRSIILILQAAEGVFADPAPELAFHTRKAYQGNRRRRMTSLSALVSQLSPCQFTHVHFDALKLMVEKGWSVNGDDTHICPLAVLLDRGDRFESPKLLEKVVEYLIQKGATLRSESKPHILVNSDLKTLSIYARKSVVYLEDLAFDIDCFSSTWTDWPTNILSPRRMIPSYLNTVILATCLSGGVSLSTVQSIDGVLREKFGEYLPSEYPPLDYAYKYAREVPSLQKCTRRKIRAAIQFRRDSFSRLPLPVAVREYIQFSELDSDEVLNEVQEVMNMSWAG